MYMYTFVNRSAKMLAILITNDGFSLANFQIRQTFPPLNFPTMQYFHAISMFIFYYNVINQISACHFPCTIIMKN